MCITEEFKFSLVLATYGRKEELKRFFESLKEQTYQNFEVIICDQNPEGFLQDILLEYEHSFRIIHLRSERGLSKARNLGLRYLTGEIVGFPDDDCLYPPSLLMDVLNRFLMDKDLAVLCGLPVNFNNKVTSGKYLSYKTQVNKYKALFAFCSYTMFMKRDVIKKVGHFDETLGLGSSYYQSAEDLDYGIRAINNSFKVVFDPEIKVFHPEKEEVIGKEQIKRSYKYALGTGYVLRKHRYSLLFSVYYISRPLAGFLIGIISMRLKKALWHLAKFIGRLRGYLLI